MVWLGWDTDKTDIDLHVVEPSGNEVYYGNRRSSIGGHLSKDFTKGYGPEVYIIKDPVPGDYVVRVKYYASHQVSALTGATSAILWTLQDSGCQLSERVRFESVRLDRHREKMDVLAVKVERPANSWTCEVELAAAAGTRWQLPAPAPAANSTSLMSSAGGSSLDLLCLIDMDGHVTESAVHEAAPAYHAQEEAMPITESVDLLGMHSVKPSDEQIEPKPAPNVQPQVAETVDLLGIVLTGPVSCLPLHAGNVEGPLDLLNLVIEGR